VRCFCVVAQAIGERENKQLNLLLMDIMDSIIRGQDPVALASSPTSTSCSGKSPSRSGETEPGMQENSSNATSSTAADGDAAPPAGKALQ
jgi:Timeless protein